MHSSILINGWGIKHNPFGDTEIHCISSSDLCSQAHSDVFSGNISERLSLALEKKLLELDTRQPVQIIGWSLGSLIAKLIVNSGFDVSSAIYLGPFLNFTQSPSRHSELGSLMTSFRSDPERALKSFALSLYKNEPWDTPLAKNNFLELLDLGHVTDHLYQGLELLESVDISQQQSRAHVPELSIYGTKDQLIPEIESLEFASHFAIETRAIEAGHLFPISKTQETLQIISEWNSKAKI